MIEPTEAHLQKACDVLNSGQTHENWTVHNDRRNSIVTALAKYIANPQPAPELVDALQEAQKMADLIAIVDQGCGGNLNPMEMAYSAMRQARNLSSALQAILAALDASKPVDPADEIMRRIGIGRELRAELKAELEARGLHITEIEP